MLTDQKRLEILLSIFDQDIEETLSLFDNKKMLESLDEDTIGRAIMLVAPSIRECNVDPKDLIELVRERLSVVLKKWPEKRSLIVKGDAPKN